MQNWEKARARLIQAINWNDSAEFHFNHFIILKSHALQHHEEKIIVSGYHPFYFDFSSSFSSTTVNAKELNIIIRLSPFHCWELLQNFICLQVKYMFLFIMTWNLGLLPKVAKDAAFVCSFCFHFVSLILLYFSLSLTISFYSASNIYQTEWK